MGWLTKSRFMSGRQCHKRLWFEVHQPLESQPADRVPFINGRAVDLVAQTLSPGVVISREDGMIAAIAETRRVMQSRAVTTLYQPAVQSGDMAVIADVLRRKGKKIALVEVKASTSVKEEHIPDAAFQTMVLRAAKIPVTQVSIRHVDKTFVLKTPGDYNGLLTEEDVTADVEKELTAVGDQAATLLGVMAADTVPVLSMGSHCNEPYECPFIERCTAAAGPVPEYPVTLLPHGSRIAAALESDGYRDLKLVPAGRLNSDMHQRVHQATVTGRHFFDRAETADLRAWRYPMAYLDFETLSMAVPEIVGTRPYQQLPFQWSLHVETSPGTVRHAEYLASESFGDFDSLARALIAAVPADCPIFAYSAGFERGRLLDLAARLATHAASLTSIANRLVDLLPIARRAYYHRDMQGSWSIKAIMPTISAELDYATLGTVRDGEGAQLAFLELLKGSPSAARRKALILDMLAYCRRDTWAMVVLRRFLCCETLNVAQVVLAA